MDKWKRERWSSSKTVTCIIFRKSVVVRLMLLLLLSGCCANNFQYFRSPSLIANHYSPFYVRISKDQYSESSLYVTDFFCVIFNVKRGFCLLDFSFGQKMYQEYFCLFLYTHVFYIQGVTYQGFGQA